MENVEAIRCSNSDCPAPAGPCQDGVTSIEECPNIELWARESKGPHEHSFFHGFSMDAQDAFAIATDRSPSVVVLVGSPKVGKTTLIAGILEAFRRGPIGEMRFAGSQTLLGLEERCHLSRRASQNLTPDTERTGLSSGNRLLHFRVQSLENESDLSDILIADVNGEEFIALRDTGDPRDLRQFFRVATDVAFLLDLSELHDPANRHTAASDAKRIMRVIQEKSLISGEARVQLILTKADVMQNGSVDAFVGELLDALEASCQAKVFSVEVHTTAMRSGAGVSAGAGLAELLPAWITTHARHASHVPSDTPALRESHKYVGPA